jgi:hypothetical protein
VNLRGVGDQRFGWELTVQLAGAQPATVLEDYVVVRVGRSVTAFAFGTPVQTTPSGPQINRLRLVGLVVSRLRRSGA